MHSSTCSPASTLLLAFWGLWACCARAGDLLAPVYPGAEHAPEYDSGHFESFLSRDPPGKVSAWYRGRLGMAPQQATGHHDWFPLMTQQEVARILHSGHRDWTRAEDAGVDVRSHPLVNSGADVEWIRSQTEPCTSDHFMVLRDLVTRGAGTQADFDALCEKYGWIEHAYYRLYDPDGLRQPMDEHLLDQARKRLYGGAYRSAEDAEALGRRMQELVTQGRFEEAGKLMEQFQGAHEASAEVPEDAWTQWVEYLQQVADHAYPTMIRIHRHPLHWASKPGTVLPE